MVSSKARFYLITSRDYKPVVKVRSVRSFPVTATVLKGVCQAASIPAITYL